MTTKEALKMKIGNSAKDFKSAILTNKEFQNELRDDPVKAASNVEISPFDDPVIYRIVVSALGATVLIAMLGAIYLAVNKIQPTPEILIAIGSAAVGALAGLLAPSPGNK